MRLMDRVMLSGLLTSRGNNDWYPKPERLRYLPLSFSFRINLFLTLQENQSTCRLQTSTNSPQPHFIVTRSLISIE